MKSWDGVLLLGIGLYILCVAIDFVAAFVYPKKAILETDDVEHPPGSSY